MLRALGPFASPGFAVVALVATSLALAAGLDSRGWSEGKVAAGSDRVLKPLPEEVPVQLPASFASTLKGPTLLIYFSPTCPHCRDAAPELNELSRRLGDAVTVVGVASGVATRDAVDEFKRTFRVPYRVDIDSDRTIAAALGVRSTPSALLIKPKDKKRKAWVAWDVYYPYVRGTDTLIEMRVNATGNPWAAFRKGEYHGNGTCAVCHKQEAEAWTLTHHSVAWRTLALKDDHSKPECTGCHVTGAGQPGGWNGDPHSELVDVGCEACHGPGGPHDGVRTDPSTTCEGCHDEKHSIAFHYTKGLPLLDHFRTVAMDDAAYRAARLALVQGEAPRALLAFADGAFVGSAQCQSCHEAEHAWWAASPHGNAMASLAADDKQADVTCVRCHASPRRSGVPPTTLDGYRVDESVGCESCHGPGEAHVAAGGGTDNIEGLGEDCPVCVLEALCTSCHTTEWDPKWELESRLDSVAHGAESTP